MKNKLLPALLALLAIVLFSGAAGKSREKAPVAKPELKVDNSSISDSRAPAVSSYADVLDGIRPAVVSVYSSKIVREQVPPMFRQLYGVQGREQKLEGLGSGVIISQDGFILTNNHVVADADELKVLLNDEREFTARVIGTDPKTDIAVIKIDATKLPFATVADSAKLRVGDVVFAIGNPLGVGQTVTMGIVSATSRRVGILDEVAGYEDFIQTDASINKGNSGGALIDAKGRLIGINSAIISNNQGQGSIGIGFAIPINLARNVMDSLIETGTVSRGYLGVSTVVLTPELAESYDLPKDTKGVIISDLNPPNGPAAKGGLKREDIITAVNDKPITSRDDLRLTIAQTPPGTEINIKYLRGGKPMTAKVTLTKLADETGGDSELLPGVGVQPLTPDIRRELNIDEGIEGIVVVEVAANSSYGSIFPVGAVIEQINTTAITDIASAKRALREGAVNRAIINYRGYRRILSFPVR